MSGWNLNGINLGPQREPASFPRLRAQQKQVAVEQREARKVRRQRLELLKLKPADIDDACKYPLELVDELRLLADLLRPPRKSPLPF